MENMIECSRCEGTGGLCKHEQRILFVDECPEAIDDCENCNFSLECPDCKGEGIVADIEVD